MMSLSPRSSPPQSIFSKKKSYTSASSYLTAVSEADAQRLVASRSRDKTPDSTPALSMNSKATSSSSQDTTFEDEYDSNDGLAHPRIPPASDQVFNTIHTEFGHCANEQYRYKSEHNYNDGPVADFEDPPYYILISIYITFLLLLCLSHMRDFLGKRFRTLAYKHLVAHDVRASSHSKEAIIDSFVYRGMHP